jgi:hypothetical protein
MKMLLCIEVDVEADTTARKVIRAATRNHLLGIIRAKQGDQYLRNVIDQDSFLVRAREASVDKGNGSNGAAPAATEDSITAPKGSSGVG